MCRNIHTHLTTLLIVLFFSGTEIGSAETADQRLASGKILTVGVNKNFSPYEFINSAGEPDGYTVDLMKEVAKVLKVEMAFVLDDWVNIKDGLQTNQLDLVSGLLYSKQRDEIYDYSIFHSTISYSLFVREGSPIRQLEHLKKSQVIVVDGVYAHEWLVNHLYYEKLIPVKSSTTALKLLASGKHDCVILPQLHGLSLLKELQIQNVEIIGPTVLEQNFGFGVTAGNSDILAALNEALFTLQLSGKYEEIYLKWFSVEDSKKTIDTIFHYLIPTAVAVFGIFSLFLSWNWILRRTVDKKTAEIEKNRQRLHQVLEGVPVPTYVVDCNGLLTHWNRACEVLTNHLEETILGTKEFEQLLYPGPVTPLPKLLLANKLAGDSHRYNGVTYKRSRFQKETYETELYFKNPETEGQWFYISAAILRDSSGKQIGVIESRQDITEIKLLERQLIQSQKMEALGTLAGGVAHDFNNILVSIISTAEVASRKYENRPEYQKYLDIILAGGRRGRDLTNQILAYSSKSTTDPKKISVTSIAQETAALIKSTCPKNIEIINKISPTQDLTIDPTHVHQIIMNLCTNAIYAMRDSGGVLEIYLNNCTVEPSPNSSTNPPPGDYIKLLVTDNGPGMEDAVYKRIYDPFFTTKERGEGTGMGLSVTSGIIKQYDGVINCVTELGAGTTFQVYLPFARGQDR